MSPEQAKGEEEPTPTSDIFSLGVVLYELLANSSPFKRKTPYATMNAIQSERAPGFAKSNAIIPTELEAIVQKCLAKTPDERFTSAISPYDALVACEAKPH